MAINPPKTINLKGVADIVFCIDKSGSMQACLDGVKNHINTFVQSLQTANPNIKIDWRIGFLAYQSDEFLQLDFTTDINSFITNMNEIPGAGGDEFTPGAIDYACSGFSWRSDANTFLIVFTDEPLEGGGSTRYPDGGAAQWPDLLNKIMQYKFRVLFFGPQCPYYQKIELTPRCVAFYHNNFDTIDFSSIMAMLGKTVSQGIAPAMQDGKTNINMVYDVSDIEIIKL
jgi:hypothetical protein